MGHKNSKTKDSKIGKLYNCPHCKKKFPPESLAKTVNEHKISCSKNINNKSKINDSSTNPSKIKNI